LHDIRHHGVKGELAMLAGIVGLCMLVMRLCPDTPTARYLHHHLAERPVAWFSRLDRRHLLFVLVAIGALLLAGEMIGTLGSADLMLSWTWDLAVYVDAVTLTAVVAAVAPVKPMMGIARSRLRTWLARSTRSHRIRRDRATPPRTGTADNDEDHPGLYVRAA
jgi:hypothetical protein